MQKKRHWSIDTTRREGSNLRISSVPSQDTSSATSDETFVLKDKEIQYSSSSSKDSTITANDSIVVNFRSSKSQRGGHAISSSSSSGKYYVPAASMSNYSHGTEVAKGPRHREQEYAGQQLSSIDAKVDSFGNTALHVASSRNDYVF